MAGTPSPRSSLQLPRVANSFNWQQWHSHDPRSSSTQSLVPSVGGQEGRQTLLIIYIHGFMGNDSSFRSFPAHVHNFLKDALADTHVIHSKIYPRYKTYKAIDVARHNFSAWLQPHESPTTDVILVGHSMGGLLAAEVALMSSNNTASGCPFRHRILGTISLDAPLLGLHPGIVVSGIASLFRPAATPATVLESQVAFERVSPDPSIYSEVAPPSGASSPTLAYFPPPPGPQPPTADPFFNPPFFNDVSFIDRGWFRNIAHFAKKHREENLVEAAATHIMSHLEFGGCLVDYPALKTRYNKLRRLEDDDQCRVRFVNYYTASTGTLKKPKQPQVVSDGCPNPANGRRFLDGYSSDVESRTSTPRMSIEDYSDSGRPTLFQELEPVPEPDELYPSEQPIENLNPHDEEPTATGNQDPSPDNAPDGDDLQLPPIPDLPSPPLPLNLDLYTNKEARKQAEKEAKRARKMYEQAVKNRDKTIKERQKLVEKHRRKSIKEAERKARDEKKTKPLQPVTLPAPQSHGPELEPEIEKRLRDALVLASAPEQAKQQQQLARQESRSTEPSTLPLPPLVAQNSNATKKKERKFCMLPSKVNGVRDPTWVRVYMEGVDEVGAHCGLFFPGPHYETLVGDVGSRIVDWVRQDASRRAVSGLG